MEWIRISNNKLKVMLSAEDTQRYDLDCQSTDSSDIMARAAFRAILSDVQRETGFDAAEDKVYIQMYPSKEGGCELFITKIGLLLSTEGESKAKNARTQEKKRRSCATAICLRELSALLLLCRRLVPEPRIQKSEAWQDENNNWWLLLSHAPSLSPALFREYGTEVPRDRAETFLAEHGRRICRERAVHILGRL
ncbi:MAG: adaptor protein MecA [Clostridia bacterium]|nr:adaptor protein MecA [Clostridia bacterium]